MTAAALTFARHAQIGRIHYTRVSPDILYELNAPEPADVLAKLGDSSDAGKVLDAYNPQQAEFKALRAKLADLRKGPAPSETKTAEKPELPRVHVPDGKILRPGMKDARVTALRKRLDIAGDKENPVYDDAVRDAVKTFQTENDINVDGNLGPNTVRTLNGERREVRQSSADPTDTIIVNMERWRWIPRDLGNPHVVVNIPDYSLTLYNNDKVYWHTKIVVGKPNLATPMISAEMKFITVNPTWNVPPSIIEKEYLPALEAGSAGARPHRPQADAGRRRHGPYFAAAGRRQRARPHPLQLPEQVPGLSARHAGQASVLARQARLQPRLHARAESADLRRKAAVAGAAEGALHRGAAWNRCSAAARSTSTSRNSSRCI